VPRATRTTSADATIVEVGTDFQASSLDVLGEARLPDPGVPAFLRRIRHGPVAEVALLSTCNRFEVYAVTDNPEGAVAALAAELHSVLGAAERLVRRDNEALAHLVSVAAGLESALLGEHEILGQVRRAHAIAAEAGTDGTLLNQLFEHALRHGRRIRRALGISGLRRSLTDVAAGWISDQLPEPECRTAAVVGAGETAAQMARHLAALGVGSLLILNRDAARAGELARSTNGSAERLEQLEERLPDLDILVLATSSPEPLLRKKALAPARRAPLLVVDLGIPPNAERSLARHRSVTMLGLGEVLALALSESSEERTRVVYSDALVQDAVDEFLSRQRSQAVNPLLRDLRAHLEQTIVEETLKGLPAEVASAHSDTEIRRFAARLSRRLLHSPSEGVRELAARESPARAEEVVRSLFFRS
jgi:glutamyl-tRNA reductase